MPRKRLVTSQSDLYYRIRFKVINQAANTVNLMKFRSATDAAILSVSINNVGRLSYRNDIAGTSLIVQSMLVKGAGKPSRSMCGLPIQPARERSGTTMS